MQLENILFLDIETVASYSDYRFISEEFKSLWDKKALNSWMNVDDKTPEDLYKEKAAIFAEFGKVIVIGIGFLKKNENEEYNFRVTALHDDNEKNLLKNFKDLLEYKFPKNIRLCAHNGKEFDFPYLCRRMTVNGIKHPKVLELSNKKPWEVNHLDTMEMWKFGDKKGFTSLDLLTNIFGIESSKHSMDGSEVHNYYYDKKDIESIKKYCIDDVIALLQVFLKMNFLDPIDKEKIKIIESITENIIN